MGIFHWPCALPPSLNIGNITVGRDSPALIVAEIGTSHGGDLETARMLIDEAARAGADCAKFQAVFAEEIVHPFTGDVQLPGGATPLFEVFGELERDVVFYSELKRRTEEAGLVFLCTPFGLKSAAILKEIGVDAVKIASPEINHIPLLRETASWEIPVVLSTGVSTLADIEAALSILPKETIILHCVTAYPAPEADSNTLCIPVLSATFGKATGISDHSLEPGLIPALSVALGGCIVEKHFTLDHDGGGLDDPVALTPGQFKEMTDTVRAIEALPEEERFGYLFDRYTEKRVTVAAGNGVKRLAESERRNYRTTNRSIITVKKIPKGSAIEPGAVALLRSEKNLSPGLPPLMLPNIIGRKVARDIADGSGLAWDDLLGTLD